MEFDSEWRPFWESCNNFTVAGGWGSVTTDSECCKCGAETVTVSCEFSWLRRTSDYIEFNVNVSQRVDLYSASPPMLTVYCVLFSIGLLFSVWLVSGYAHVFILLSIYAWGALQVLYAFAFAFTLQCHCTLALHGTSRFASPRRASPPPGRQIYLGPTYLSVGDCKSS